MKTTFALRAALLALCLASPSTLTNATEVETAPVTNGYDVAVRERQQRELYDRLWSRKLPVDRPAIVVRLSPEELAQIATEQPERMIKSPLELRQRVGIVKSVSHRVDLRSFNSADPPRSPSPSAGGVLMSRPGRLTWSAAVSVENASAIRLQFASLKLPAGAALYLFNDEGQVDGPYTDTGPRGNRSFWSRTLRGETVYLQLELDQEPSDEDLRDLHFVIANVAHVGPLFKALDLWSSCRSTAGCVQRIDETANNAVDDARKGVAHMQFVSGPYVYICTGGLLNDRDATTEHNYFLTANHCISNATEAGSLETFFQYTECGTGATAPLPTDAVGAQLLAGSRKSDFTLLELNGVVPNGSSRLGWTDGQVARTNGAALYRISHPSGAPQSYSEHAVDTGAPTCRSWPRGSWIYSRDTRGATEGGSSGSPVLNSAGQVVGQLSGACGYAVSEVCDSVQNATVDGAFAAYFSTISEWLDPAPGQGGNQPPAASFSYTVNELVAEFTDTSTDPDGAADITFREWDLGDGSTTSIQSPLHTYTESGTYSVALTVTDAAGNSDSYSASVTVGDGSGSSTPTVSVTSLDAVAACDNRGRWQLQITVHLEPALNGAVVTGSWSGDAKGAGSCTTGDAGTCQVDKKSLKNNSTAIFTVQSVDSPGYIFSAGAGDSVEITNTCP